MNDFEQAKAQYEEIDAFHTRWYLQKADSDTISQEIHESVLSVETRTHWSAAGSGDSEPGDFRIVLCTGGPHVELRGVLDRLNEPCNTRLMVQSWGTPLEEWTGADEKILDWFAGHFYFGS